MVGITPRAAAIAVALTALCFSATAGNAAEREFLKRFDGSFSGRGIVHLSSMKGPNQVNCTLVGQPSESGISISGKCGIAGFSKTVGADLRFNPSTGRYSGTYVGASVGAAALYGKRKGDSVVLTITWPRPVNGDTKATMTIRNSGNGNLAITVTDELEPGGARAKVTQLALAQS
jgi:hypothetical protein